MKRRLALAAETLRTLWGNALDGVTGGAGAACAPASRICSIARDCKIDGPTDPRGGRP